MGLAVSLVVLLVRAAWLARPIPGDRGTLLVGSAAGLAAGAVALTVGFTHAATTPLLCVLAGVLASRPAAPQERAWVRSGVAVVGSAWVLVLVLACVGETAMARGLSAACAGRVDEATAQLELARTLRPWDPDVAVLATAAFAPGTDAGDVPSAREASRGRRTPWRPFPAPSRRPGRGPSRSG